MKKAKQNLFVDGVEYKAGHLYSPEAVAHIDASDFEEVEAQESEVIETADEAVKVAEGTVNETEEVVTSEETATETADEAVETEAEEVLE